MSAPEAFILPYWVKVGQSTFSLSISGLSRDRVLEEVGIDRSTFDIL